jgi:CRISPR-associated exonuclease Cas4
VNIAAWLLSAGLLLLGLAWWLRQRSGIPVGEITYSDTDAPAQPLISSRYGLVGKPDYIVLHKGLPIPIEVKPNRSADEPYESDRLQIAAYCLLVEEVNAKTPPFGVLRYRDQSFRIDFTPILRGHVIRLLDEIRSCLDADDVARSHRNAARCAACGFRRSCEQSLAR